MANIKPFCKCGHPGNSALQVHSVTRCYTKPAHTPNYVEGWAVYDYRDGAMPRPCMVSDAFGDIVARNLTIENARLIAAAPDLLAFVLKCNAGKYGTEDDILKDSCALIIRATEGK